MTSVPIPGLYDEELGVSLVFTAYESVALGPNRTLYSWNHAGSYNQPLLTELKRTGEAINWYRLGGSESAVIEPVEQTTWTGAFVSGVGPSVPSSMHIATSSNALFLSGTYSNEYRNGSNPPQGSLPPFVARYDLDGERVWFHQFAAELFPDGLLIVATLVVDQMGNLTVVASDNGARWYVFKLDGDTGALM
jgi:hypothetical protein